MMIFRLVLKLEISYKVIISGRILVSFRGFFEDYIYMSIFPWNFIFFQMGKKQGNKKKSCLCKKGGGAGVGGSNTCAFS
jgi:hypothetical protein